MFVRFSRFVARVEEDIEVLLADPILGILLAALAVFVGFLGIRLFADAVVWWIQ